MRQVDGMPDALTDPGCNKPRFSPVKIVSTATQGRNVRETQMLALIDNDCGTEQEGRS
jgi:hypothetical protein